jgi:hypothetical protein
LFEWNNKPIGIVAIINQPGPNERKYAMAISRIVIIPDFQGMGLGIKLTEFCGGLIRNENGLCFIKTVNPALGIYYNKSKTWRGTANNGKSRTIKEDTDKSAKNRLERASYCHEYIGESISGYEDLLLPINEMRNKNANVLF